MKTTFRKLVSFVLVLCVFLTPVLSAMADENEEGIADVVAQEIPQEVAPQEPVQEELVNEEPETEQIVGNQSEQVKLPAEDEPKQEEPVEDESKQEEPVEDESKQEELVEDEPKQEEPVEDEPKQEEPVEDEPKQEEVIIDPALAVPTDVVLGTGISTDVRISSGLNTKAYAVYNMEITGLLTIEFKSAAGNTAHGNIKISVTSEEGDVLWTKMWSTYIGSVSFSGFVEKGEYTITLEKSDPSDDAAYVITAKPTVERTGEKGNRNNTQNNAAEIALNEVATGIVTLQDIVANRNDYYKLTLASPGKVTIKCTNLTMNDLWIWIYGNDTTTENQIASMNVTAPPVNNRDEKNATTVSRDGWFDAGVYYILVIPITGAVDGRYKLEVNETTITITEKEKNDTFSKAYNNGSFLTLNGDTVDCLLSESDGNDCYVFNLSQPTRVNFSLKIHFPGVTAAVYDRDGNKIADSDFGQTGVPGSEGNPYELELRNLLLNSGYYYAKVSWDTNKDTGRYSIKGTTSITASTLKSTVSTDNKDVTIEGTISGAPATPSTSYIHIYQQDGSVQKLLETYTFSNAQSVKVNYKPKSSGTYFVQYVVTNGVLWHDLWDSFDVTVPEFSIISISAIPASDGTIQCRAEYTGNGSLLGSQAALYKNSIIVQKLDLGGKQDWTFTAPASGTYSIQFSATLTGAVWKDGWTTCKVTVPLNAPLKVSSLNVNSSNDGTINCSATLANGKAPQKVIFALYNSANKEIARKETTNTTSASFKVGANGLYKVQCVAYDGTTWADKWASTSVTLSPASVLTVTSLTATADSDGTGVVKLQGTTQGGKALTYSKFFIYDGSTIIASTDAINGEAVATLYKEGTYTVQYTVSDGTRWADKWTTVTVSLNDEHKPVVITSLSAVTDASGAITVTSAYTSGRPLQRLDYYVYDSANDIVNAKYSTNSTTATLFVTKSGNYKIQAVGFDGYVWADKWTSIAVTVPGSSSTTLSVSSVDASITGPNGVALSATTNDSRSLQYSRFFIYRDDTIILMIDAPLKEANYSGLPAGNYKVQYVAYDGATWADGWTTFTMGTSSLSVDSVYYYRLGKTVECSANITKDLPIQVACFALYDENDKIVAQWNWDGTGEYLTHLFTIDTAQIIKKVQYVVYDGVKWTDGWKTV